MAEHHHMVVRYRSPPPAGLMAELHAEHIMSVCRTAATVVDVVEGCDPGAGRWWSHCEWEPEPTCRYVPRGSWLVRARIAMHRRACG